jgi:DNA replication protein DnaC
MFTRMAGFPSVKTLEEFDFKFATGVPKAMVNQLQRVAGRMDLHPDRTGRL